MALEAVVETVVTFVREHESWAAPVAFIVAFGESFCFLSLLIPGTAILVGIAALLAASGVEAHILPSAIIAAALGGSLGYAVSFWIGRYFKDSVHNIWPFTTRPHLITQSQEFFEHYGAFGVFLGHFFGPVRAVIPVVAGMFRMRELPFQIANVLSAIIWSAGVIAPSFFLVTFKDEVIAFLHAHQYAVLSVILLLAIANSIPRPILFVPTLLLVLGLGTLMVIGNGNFPMVWIAAAIGAFIGDFYAYYKGILHRQARIETWPFSATKKQHADARAFVESRGLPSLFISKFQGFNRGLVPLETGNLERPMGSFLVASASSALLWALAVLLPALVVGKIVA
ncbi:VTT domain-containing protein [Hyphomicrobium sp. LHD-15]|uniref:DedA family protein n=1 Tax=Hyphomicrobium sp. LHD-15 TaxID=3072142 RepID=UPI00280FD0A7|nr:VTT domain-containing protein [Hyphomicrobium sp. LHD-15]MDQ8700833.1 VTT domain-containing protein [Hyphomicrobium sp. LHD-15]